MNDFMFLFDHLDSHTVVRFDAESCFIVDMVERQVIKMKCVNSTMFSKPIQIYRMWRISNFTNFPEIDDDCLWEEQMWSSQTLWCSAKDVILRLKFLGVLMQV